MFNKLCCLVCFVNLLLAFFTPVLSILYLSYIYSNKVVQEHKGTLLIFTN